MSGACWNGWPKRLSGVFPLLPCATRSGPRQWAGRSGRRRGQGTPERAAAWAGRSDRAAAQHGGGRVRAVRSGRARAPLPCAPIRPTANALPCAFGPAHGKGPVCCVSWPVHTANKFKFLFQILKHFLFNFFLQALWYYISCFTLYHIFSLHC